LAQLLLILLGGCHLFLQLLVGRLQCSAQMR